MEQPPQDETPIVLNSDNFLQFLTSKNFKHRILAYQSINEYPQLVNHLQNEAMAVGLEVALDSLLNFTGKLTNDQISNLYTQFSQNKATIKTKISEVIDIAFKNDFLSVLKGLINCLGHKNAKVIFGCLNKINSLINNNLELFRSKENMKVLNEELCPKLEILLSNADKDAKTEASALCLTLYRIFYDDLLKYIENVKPIILKDIKESFKDVEVPKREVKMSDLDFDHSDWKERLNSINIIKDNIDRMSNINEVIPIISRKTKDVNLSVAISAIECIKNGKINNSDCIKGMIERFKDKKATLSQLIIETIGIIKPDINILIDGLSNKNPEIRLGILECIKLYTVSKRIGEIGKMLDDGSADIRKAAVDILLKVDNIDELSDSQKSKMNKIKPMQSNTNNSNVQSNNNSNININAINMTNINNSNKSPNQSNINNNINSNKSPNKTNNNININNTSKRNSFDSSKVFDQFNEKFPQLFDKDWNKRINFVQENNEKIKNEGSYAILQYLISSKETNINIIKEFMVILDSFDDLSNISSDLCTFLISKVTELKLKENIIELFKKIDKNIAIQNILLSLEQNKVGKKFLCLLDVLSNILTEQNSLIDKFLDKIKIFGMQEKKALNDFIVEYKMITTDGLKIIKPVEIKEKKSALFPFNDDNSGFTKEFIDLFDKDPFIAVGILEKVDVCKFASKIIWLYCHYNLPSPYFNSLILHLISRRFILDFKDAQVLISHLINHSMDSEIDLMDRIYPATKLYTILRLNQSNSGLIAIFNLVKKYKNMSELSIKDIEGAVKNNEDFIGFTTSIDKIIDLRREINTKLETDFPPLLRNEDQNNFERLETDFPPLLKNENFVEDQNYHQKIIEEKRNYQNLMKDENEDLDNLEDSIIIEKSNLSMEETKVDNLPSHISASIVVAPSIADNDSLLIEEPKKESDCFNIPVSKVDGIDFSYEIEKSLENISISTTPLKKKRNFSEIEDVLNKISSDITEISIEGLNRLMKIIIENPNSISFSSNTIISSILIQLMTTYDDINYKSISLNVLLKFTQNTSFCSCLRYETLKSVHLDLIPLVKDQNTIADVLINLCLNCELSILKVYFDLLEDSNEILMKLIWRHSKNIKYASVETTAMLIKIIDDFYENKKGFLSKTDNITIKVCLLHLKECVSAFSDNLKQFGIGRTTDQIITLLLSGKEFNIEEVRNIFKSSN